MSGGQIVTLTSQAIVRAPEGIQVSIPLTLPADFFATGIRFACSNGVDSASCPSGASYTVSSTGITYQKPSAGTDIWDIEVVGAFSALATAGDALFQVCIADGVEQRCESAPVTYAQAATATSIATETPTPTVTATNVATETPTPTVTATSIATETPTPTVTATSIATETPTPTVTATSIATEPPTPTVTATSIATEPPTPTQALEPDSPLTLELPVVLADGGAFPPDSTVCIDGTDISACQPLFPELAVTIGVSVRGPSEVHVRFAELPPGPYTISLREMDPYPDLAFLVDVKAGPLPGSGPVVMEPLVVPLAGEEPLASPVVLPQVTGSQPSSTDRAASATGRNSSGHSDFVTTLPSTGHRTGDDDSSFMPLVMVLVTMLIAIVAVWHYLRSRLP